MELKPPSLPRSPRPCQRGVALVLVLGGLVLISILLLAFLHSISTEVRASKSYADGSSVRMQADAAVNVVIGQIQEATKTRNGSTRLAWASQPGMIRTYTDSGTAAGYYKLYSSPQMNGSGAFSPAGDAPPADWAGSPSLFTDLNEPMPGTTSGSLLFPIVDPSAQSAGVEGFSITGAPGATTTQPVPMPVRWLYVLQNGQMIAPVSGAGGKASFNAPELTSSNPIVARIAFWTDDETAKININTASEGSFWDMPRTNSTPDVALGLSQPSRGEFQRYPGHPATTSLSAALGGKLPTTAGVEPADYYTLAPRIQPGGSKAGTVQINNVAKITADKDRLYATVDELEFRPDRTALPSASINVGADDLKKLRFFLTANSRSPDLNLFNRPRVGIWPIHATDDANHRTLLDKSIAFCGTVGGLAYYFQRSNPDSPTEDLSLGRNPALRGYLRNLTAENIPGFGGSFADKYPSDRTQILTEIFDYVRSTNLCDSNEGAAGFVSYTPRTISTGSGKGQVVPIHDASDNTKGFGRFPTLTEAALLFVAVPEDSEGDPYLGEMRVQPAFLPELFDPSLGFPTTIGKFSIRVSGLSSFLWDDNSPMFSADSVTVNFSRKMTSATFNQNLTRHFGGGWGTRLAMFTSNNAGTNAGLIGTKSPLVPNPDVTAGSTFVFRGGTATVEFLSPGGEVAQSITLDFPAGTIPTPKVVPFSYNPDPEKAGTFQIKDFHDIAARFKGESGERDSCWITEFDSVRSVSLRDGDARIAAGRFSVNDSGQASDIFSPLPNSGPTDQMSHTLIEGPGQAFYGALRGRLVKDAPYLRSNQANPTARNRLQDSGFSFLYMNQDVGYNGVALGLHRAFSTGDIPGDWDNGFGDVQDGPYINRPDEGAFITAGTSGDTSKGAYFNNANILPAVDQSGTIFSPNRQIPSAVMFGSLPTGVKSNRPWQTLLFRPDPLGTHPGSKDRKGDGSDLTGAPPDHLLLDLFHMPVVEPYPISEPLSTAGRINMNAQIVPFTYIRRETGLYAVLKTEKLLAVPNTGTVDNVGNSTTATDYKRTTVGTAVSTDWRKNLDLPETLQGFRARFDAGEIFKSASEICEIPFVPAGATYAQVSNTSEDFWSTNYPLTGDNSREKPYADIYPRLTTKSNTYTVHYRVQSLQRSRQRIMNAPSEFDTAAGDQVTGELRGSTLIERYIDPADAGLADFATAPLTDTSADLDSHYRFRILGMKRFVP